MATAAEGGGSNDSNNKSTQQREAADLQMLQVQSTARNLVTEQPLLVVPNGAALRQQPTNMTSTSTSSTRRSSPTCVQNSTPVCLFDKRAGATSAREMRIPPPPPTLPECRPIRRQACQANRAQRRKTPSHHQHRACCLSCRRTREAAMPSVPRSTAPSPFLYIHHRKLFNSVVFFVFFTNFFLNLRFFNESGTLVRTYQYHLGALTRR